MYNVNRGTNFFVSNDFIFKKIIRIYQVNGINKLYGHRLIHVHDIDILE